MRTTIPAVARVRMVCCGALIGVIAFFGNAHAQVTFPVPQRYEALRVPAQLAGQNFADSICLFISLDEAVTKESTDAANKQLDEARDKLASALAALGDVRSGMSGGETVFQDPRETSEDYQTAWAVLNAYKIEQFGTFEEIATVVSDIWSEYLARRKARVTTLSDAPMCYVSIKKNPWRTTGRSLWATHGDDQPFHPSPR